MNIEANYAESKVNDAKGLLEPFSLFSLFLFKYFFFFVSYEREREKSVNDSSNSRELLSSMMMTTAHKKYVPTYSSRQL